MTPTRVTPTRVTRMSKTTRSTSVRLVEQSGRADHSGSLLRIGGEASANTGNLETEKNPAAYASRLTIWVSRWP